MEPEDGRFQWQTGFLSKSSHPAKASDYLIGIAEYLIRSNRLLAFVVYVRVSSRNQYRRGNLAWQADYVRWKLKRMGITPIKWFIEYESGTTENFGKRIKAAKYAKLHNAAIVALSHDRFLRSTWFTENNGIQPEAAEWEQLKVATLGVPLLTILPPAMPYREIASRYIRWGIKWKQFTRNHLKAGESGYLAKRKKALAAKAVKSIQAKMSYREVAFVFKVKISTVVGWCKSYLNAC